MEKKRVKASEVLADIRGGLTDQALMQKYGLSEKGLDSLFKKLLASGLFEQSEWENRKAVSEKIIEIAWKCPACGKPQTREYRECPACGVIVSKFIESQLKRKNCPKCGLSQPIGYVRCPQCGFDWGKHESELALARQLEQYLYEGIPTIRSSIILKGDEVAYYASQVEVCQQRTESKTFRTYLGSRARLFKVPIYFGASMPHKISQEVIAPLGRGEFVITNKRVVLTGPKISYSIKKEKINGMQLFSDALQIFDESSRGGRFYRVDNPREAAIILSVVLNEDGTPGWQRAIQDGKANTVERLLEEGLDVNTSTKDGLTPMMIACTKGDLSLVKLLLNRGAAIDAKAKAKVTSLMLAAAQGHIEVVRLLLDRGADLSQRDRDGFTALDHATNKGQIEIESILKAASAQKS